MASSALYTKALVQFRQDAERKYQSKNDPLLLVEFLRDRSTAQETQVAAQKLRDDAGKKYGDKKAGSAKIPGEWISNIMGNIGNVITVGNFATSGAPECVGLAWYAVKTILGAIQSNYELYGIFGSGLTNMTEIMLITAHYDRLFYEKSKGGWEPSEVVAALFKTITNVYSSILDFSFSVKRHITGNAWQKLKHGLNDMFGANKREFEGKIDGIATQKKKLLELSKAAFDDKTLGQLQGIRDITEDIHRTVDAIEKFQPTLEGFHHEQMAWLESIQKNVEDIKHTMKPKTPWDYAMLEFEKVKKTLNPMKGNAGSLRGLQEQVFPGTCQWIYEEDRSCFPSWEQEIQRNRAVCISGEEGSGKSTLLASLYERLSTKHGKTKTAILYFACDTSGSGVAVNKRGPSLSTVCNTLLYDLYYSATVVEDVGLLESCNKVFVDPKTRPDPKTASNMVTVLKPNEEYVPDFSDGLNRLATLLKTDVIVILDAIESLSAKEQGQLVAALKSLVAIKGVQRIRLLMGCRAGEPFCQDIKEAESFDSIDIGTNNRGDIELRLSAELKNVPGLANADVESARTAILQAAGSNFRYITETAIPFLLEPFEGSLSERLEALPDGVNSTYRDSMERMGANYLGLLRTAISWCLLTVYRWPTAEEIMDAFYHIYDSDPGEEELADTAGSEFPPVSEIMMKQLKDASGVFLEIETVGSYNWITLRDYPQIEKFCLSSASTVEAADYHRDDLCFRCKLQASNVKTLKVVAKDDHLDRAILCLRHLNNRIFQKRAGLLEAQDSTPPAAEEDQQSHSSDDDASISDDEDDLGSVRYEIQLWPYHLREAEKLWPNEERSDKRWSDLMRELDHFSKNTPVFHAWQSTYAAVMRREGNDTNYLRNAQKPLHVASYLGLVSWAEHLLDQGADPNEVSGPCNALQAASHEALSLDLLKLLLERGGDINFRTETFGSAFHNWLRIDPSKESIELMLKHGADRLKASAKGRWTAIHVFALQGHLVEALDLLLDSDPDKAREQINALTAENETPIHILMQRQDAPMSLLEAFLEKGANINVDDGTSIRPLQLAAAWGNLEQLKVLVKHGVTEIDDPDDDGDTALHQAGISGYSDCLEVLAGEGGNVNSLNNRNRAAIHDAAFGGFDECVLKLLELKADPNSLDNEGKTPLFEACTSDSHKCANIILDHLLEKKIPTSEINRLTKDKRTPLYQAASRGYEEVVEKLVKAAQSDEDIASLHIDEKDAEKEMTALHRAALYEHSRCVQLLVDAGADVSVADKNNKTAVQLACEKWAFQDDQSSFPDIISLLIEKDPETAKMDAELHAVCAVHGSVRLLRQLHGLGADLNRPDQYGWTPRDLAMKYQQDDATAFLKTQAAWSSTLPARWVDGRTAFSDDGLAVTHTSGERICISTDRPLPAGVETYYFEVTLLEPAAAAPSPEGGASSSSPSPPRRPPPTYPIVGIGFCTLGGAVIEFPGWRPLDDARSARSWGYHGDDGGFFTSASGDSWATTYGTRYRAGDTVGCGVDLVARTLWFTHNGKKLEHTFSDVQGRLFPLLGLKDAVQLRTNFKGPYLWKQDAE